MQRPIADTIGALAVEAMLYEVSATPKPGLVDRHDCGAHRDMDFFTFMSSAAALRRSFDEFAGAGMAGADEPAERLLPRLQMIGRQAEQDMFALTKGVNTHKGLIFSLGLLTGAAGWMAGQPGFAGDFTADSLGDLVSAMCHGIVEQAYGQLRETAAGGLTKGEAMYLRYGVTGVRGEAESGYRTVRQLSLPAYRQARAEGASVNDALVDTLMVIIAGTTDTNILGRHDRAALEYAQQMAGEAIAAGGIRTVEGRAFIEHMNDEFIARWISPGGSADLVAVTHFLYRLENMK